MILYKESPYKKYYVKENGEILSLTKGTGKLKFLSPQKNSKGYCRVYINGKREFVHRIVASIYVPTLKDKTQLTVNHKDGDKSNNNYKNLEWLTNNENMKHARTNNLFPVNSNRKFKEKEINYIRNKYKENNISYKEIAKEFNVATSVIGEIIRRESYKEYV